MNVKQSKMVVGAIKSFVAGSTGIVLSLNIVDADKFNVMTVGGWKHLAVAILIAGAVSESRFLNQWANSADPPDEENKTPKGG